jgi:formylglycine-generating enzyme required for sulfatase activity
MKKSVLWVIGCLMTCRVLAGEPATAEAIVTHGFVTGITVISGGSGYITEPTVTLTGGEGSGATAKAILNGDMVSLIIVLSAGSGYTSSPTVIIEEPPRPIGVSLELVPKITVDGPPGSLARVEWSENLEGPWNVWSNIVVEVVGTVLVDLSPGSTLRFYRAVGVPTYPPPSTEDFALIPAGTFEMGDNFNEGRVNELPVHTVYLDAFYMGRTEVTKEQWDDVRAWATANGYTLWDFRNAKGPDYPISNIPWVEVVKWCNAASEQEGLVPVYRLRANGEIFRTGSGDDGREIEIRYEANGYRLPSEAEWEKAARGGETDLRFPWGNTITHANANYNSCLIDCYTEDGPYSGSFVFNYDESATQGYHPEYHTSGGNFIGRQSPVGSFPPNGYGLYDMVGNAWEWCNDWYNAQYYANSPSSNPKGPISGSTRVLRGGAWHNFAFFGRNASRFYGVDYWDAWGGFRLARSFAP